MKKGLVQWKDLWSVESYETVTFSELPITSYFLSSRKNI